MQQEVKTAAEALIREILLTWTTFGTRNGARASIVTTHGDMVVPKFLARKGPRGTYSHFCRQVENSGHIRW